MQLWQQQLVSKQLQERRRLLQLQQLDQEARQLSPHSQLTAGGKPAAGNQLPETLNEMALNDAYNYIWPNNFVGGISNIPSNPQMFMAGNMNLVQPGCSTGLQNLENGVILNDQSRAMRPMGFMPIQNDQSIFGMPVLGTSHADQYSQFLALSNNCNDLLTTASVAMPEKASRPSSTFQSDQQSAAQVCLQDTASATQYFQGRHAFGNSSMQVLSNDVSSGNFQQANNLQLHDQFHEFHGRQAQDGLPANSQEKSVSQVGTSVGVASLDPIEQKLLFGTDDENWGASFGGSLISSMGGDMHGSPLDNDYSGALPSINSGSWSALMQEAVQASSSDKGGVQEEWSGLSSQKIEQPIGKPLIATNGNGKQPAAWDVRNLQNAISLTSRSFPLFNDPNATRSSSISSQGASNKEFLNSQLQTKLIESGRQGKMPSVSGIWTGQSTEQCENSSTGIQFKSQDMGDGWIGQQNLPLSGASIQPVHSLSGWQTSYPMTSRGDSNSNYHEIHGNLWKVGENHVNLNSALQHANSDIGNPKIQAEDPFATNLGSIGNPNMIKLDQNMHQQVINEQNSVFGRHLTTNTYLNQVDKDDENQKQQSRRQQAWELSTSPSAERLVDSGEKEKDNGILPGKGYVGDAAKELSGSHKSPVQYGQHALGPQIFQTGNLKKIAEPSFPANHKLSLQQLSNSGFDGSNTMEQSFVGQSHFSGNVCNDHVDSSKRISSEAEGLQYRNDIVSRASSSSFDGSTSQYSHNETILRSSNNMLELLHKVDQSRNGDSMNVSDTSAQAAAHVPVTYPHFDPSSNVRALGLRLAPPSQRHSLQNYVPNSKQLLNDIKVGLSGETGYQNQASADYTSSAQHVPYLDEALETEKWDKLSILSGHQHNKHPGSNKYCKSSSATVSDSPLVENQLQEQWQLQQKDISSTKGHLEQKWKQQKHNNFNTSSHESPDQSVKISFGNQTNVGALGKNASHNNNLHDSHDGAVAGQSIQTSLPTLGGRFSTSDVVSIAENQVTGDSQFPSGGIDHMKPAFAGFSQVSNSGKQLPVVETKLGSQPSISGISQQAGSSKMLHNVWTNISAQQRLAGINPLLTPNILQSIINHGRDRNSWAIPKAGSHQVNKGEVAPPEVGTSSNSQKEEDHPLQGKSSNAHTEKVVDAACKSRTATQGGETVLKPSFDGGSGVPISSLVRQHQLDVNKAKNDQAPAVASQVSHSPTNVASSSNDIGVSGHMSKPSDAQPHNYSLLHQIQSMKAADSDINKMSGNVVKGVSFSSDTSQRNFNIHQRFDHGQCSASRFPADVKVGETSQVSYSLDAKMLSFASNDSEEKFPSTSAAGQHDLQTKMHPIDASATTTMLGGGEHSRISPQMAPSWFDHYGNYQNGRMAALYAAQRSGNPAVQRYFLQKIPARMEDSSSVEPRLNNNQVGSDRQGMFATKITPSESSGSLLPSSIMDHGIILRSKKRKSLTAGMPWHKIVMECPQSLQDISWAELDWNLVANRLMEKVDDDTEAVEDDPSVPPSRRRLIMTTQLMHQLIPSVPAALLKGEATLAYESVTFSVAKSALADACSLISSTKSDLHVPLENETTTSGELRSSKVQYDTNSNIAEDFINRSKKLDADFSRLEKGSSMLDVRLECQDLERFSIVNRLGKFHSRPHADGVEVSATGAVHRTFPQRYITALPVPGNLPDGVPCLSL